MNTLARNWLLVTIAGYVLFVAGLITVAEWTVGTGVVATLVIAARYDMERSRQR